jgi:hypothetical protein
MKVVALVVLIAAMATAGRSQVGMNNVDGGEELQQSVFGIGLNGGMVSGIGLSFRHHLPSRFSYQIVGGVIKTDEHLHYSVGTEAQFDFMYSDFTRVFAAGGAGYFYSGSSSSNDLESPFRMGLGVGVEHLFGENLALGGELLFTFFSDGTILPLPQASMHYYFR